MRFDVLTIFPEMFAGPLHTSILKRAQDQQIINCQLYDFRSFSNNKHGKVDDTPYGGGAGMVLAPQPIVDAWKSISKLEKTRTILLTPTGKMFNYAKAAELVQYDQLILICGHYEGIDERVSELLVDEHLSIGDYVLTGGELAAMVVIDAVSRLIPGVIGSPDSLSFESHTDGLLEYSQYTKPKEYAGLSVPKVLLSGNHLKITKWRRKSSLLNTLKFRPDLLAKYQLSSEEQMILENREG